MLLSMANGTIATLNKAAVLTFIALSSVFACSRAMADEVVLKNGDKLTGTIGQITAGTLNFTSPVLGALAIKLTDIQSYKTDAPATVQLKAGTSFSSPIVSGTTTQITTANDTTTPLDTVKSVNPPAQAWTGAIVFNGVLNRGNTNNASAGLSAAAVLRRDNPFYNDRFTLGADYNYVKSGRGSNSTTTSDNDDALFKYDRFFTDKLYGYAEVGYLHDRIAGLNTQLTPGVGLGYQWIESPALNFDTEAGVNYVYEDYEGSGVDQKADGRLAYHVDHKFNDTVSVFHDLEYLTAFEDPADYLLNSDLGIRADFTKSFFSQFKVVYRRNDRPATGAEKDDLSFLLGVGWKF